MIDEIRSQLQNDETSSAVLWLTSEVRNSATIRNDEIPLALQRGMQNDGFFVVPVAAGGVGYGDVNDVVGPASAHYNLGVWNMLRTQGTDATAEDIRAVANRVLEGRLKRLHATLDRGVPLRVGVFFANVPDASGYHLLMEWTHVTRPDKSLLESDIILRWLPALLDLRDAIARHASGRAVEFTGQIPIPCATLLGSAFSETSGIEVRWLPPQNPGQFWSIRESREPTGFIVKEGPATSEGDALAILVSFRSDAIADYTASLNSLGVRFRKSYLVLPPQDSKVFMFKVPGQASDLAWQISELITNARAEFAGVRSVHLFMALPVGIALLIGQLLNRLGAVQLYNHSPANDPPYTPALPPYTPHALDLGLNRMVADS
ncbi:MAG: SAVED domain-containing protein [Thiotrichales bacterium]